MKKQVWLFLIVMLLFPLLSTAEWSPAGLPLSPWQTNSLEVFPDQAGGAWIVYDHRLEMGIATCIQHVDASGEFLFDAPGVALRLSMTENFRRLAVSWDGAEPFTILYTIESDLGQSGVWTYEWNTIAAAVQSPVTQLYPNQLLPATDPAVVRMAPRSDGGFWYAFISSRGELFLVGVTGTGDPVTDQPILIDQVNLEGASAAILTDDSDGAWIVWYPGGNGHTLYQQRLFADGSQMFLSPDALGAYHVPGGKLQLFPGYSGGYWAFYTHDDLTNVHRVLENGNWFGLFFIPSSIYEIGGIDGIHAIEEHKINYFMLYSLPNIESKRVISQNFRINGDGSSSGNSIGVTPWNPDYYDALQVLRDKETDWKTLFLVVARPQDPETSLTLLPIYLDRLNRNVGEDRDAAIQWTVENPEFPDRWAWQLSDGYALVALPFGEDEGVRDVRLFHFRPVQGQDGGIALSAPETSHPFQFALHAPSPNPFNASTVIRYDLPDTREVTLRLFDLRGRQVAELVRGIQAAGQHQVILNSENSLAGSLSSGVYFLQLNTDGERQTRKLVLLK